MKKKLFALLLVAAMAIAAVAFTACSAKEEEPEVPTTAAAEENLNGNPNDIEDADESEDASGGAEDEDVSSGTPAIGLDELVAEQNAAMDAMSASSGGQFTATVKEDGGKLIYAFTYAIEMPADALQASLDSYGTSFGAQLTSFKEAGYAINAVVIQFLDQDGNELASKEFN